MSAGSRRLRPDVVLMDIQMPGVDGLHATRRITGSAELASRVVSSLLAKLGLRDRVQAVVLAYESRLVTPGA